MAAMRRPAGIGSEVDEALVRAGRCVPQGRRLRLAPCGRCRSLVAGKRTASTRDRWSCDKVVHSAHGVNCTRSCSWKVYVKDGIITWEAQQTEFSAGRAGLPRRAGARAVRRSPGTPTSPTRVRYPFVRGVLLEPFREAESRP